MVTATVIMLIALTTYYSWFLLRARSGLNRLVIPEHPSSLTPVVTVVIAARNEELTIGNCVRSILDQRYPAQQLEIIVVDDHSSDTTVEIVKRISEVRNKVRVLSLQKNDEKLSAGKPAAISAGIDAAEGDIIFTTDADCIVPPNWISSTIQCFLPATAFVAGPVRIGENGGFLSRVDRLELLGLVTMGAGLIGAGRPVICNGANLAYRKSSFLAARGYGGDQAWCEDETIMHRIHDRRLGTIVFNSDAESVVTTAASASLRAFWKQRLRWSSKGGHYENTSILLSLVLLYFYFLIFLTTTIAGIFYSTVLIWVFASFLVKLVTDYATLSAGARLFRDRIPGSAFLIAEIFHVPYIVVIAALGQFTSFTWKGRKINT